MNFEPLRSGLKNFSFKFFLPEKNQKNALDLPIDLAGDNCSSIYNQLGQGSHGQQKILGHGWPGRVIVGSRDDEKLRGCQAD
jgi:hypothetical protein